MIGNAGSTVPREGPPPPPWRPDPSSLSLLEHGCGLLDRSWLGRLVLDGTDSKELLQGLLSNDIEALLPGTGCEAALLTPKGKLLAIVRVLNIAPDRFHLTTDRISLQGLFDAINRAAVGHQAELTKGTLETAHYSLIGPRADRVAGAVDLGREHMNREAMLGGSRVTIAVTAAGVDVICPAEKGAGVRTALLAAGAEEADEAAAQCLRVMAGMPLYGVDLDDTVIPQEADLNHRLVSFTKGCYVGQETVARLFYKGSPNRSLRGLLLDDEIACGTALTDSAGKDLGRVGSVAAPPGDAAIGLALVRLEATPGSVISAGGVEAEVVELPFPVLDSPSGAA